MKIAIFGGGPCGMRLAQNLSKDHQVHLYEQDKKLGGCWKVDWNRGYFTEHAPRVISTGYTTFMKHIKYLNITKPEFKEIYGSNFYTKNLFYKFFYNNMTLLDMTKFIMGLTSVYISDTRTVPQWIKDKNISPKGTKAFKVFSLSVAGTYDYCSIGALFESIRTAGNNNFVQLTGGDEWLIKWEKVLQTKIKIHKNTPLVSLDVRGKEVDCAYTSKGKVKADVYIMCLPLYPMVNIFENSNSETLKNNWDSWKRFKKFCYNSSYSGFGFQLHFKEEEKFYEKWCQECMGDWNIIALESSKVLREASKIKSIKTVWSCIVINTNQKSKKLKKCINQIEDKDVILEEALRQMSSCIGRKLEPHKMTISDGLYYDKKHKYWDMKNSAYAVTPTGYLSTQGRKINNLHAVGCFNNFEVSVLEGAFKAADKFSLEKTPKLNF